MKSMLIHLRKYFSAHVVVLFCLLHISCSMVGQDYRFTKRSVPKSYLTISTKVSLPKGIDFVEAEKYLPAGYSKSGDVDYTKYLQKVLNENRNVLMPNFPVLINDNGLKIQSNSKVFFRDKSQLILAPSPKGIYHILFLKDCQNVKIYNPKIVGDRAKHTGTKGEWGMGISIYSSNNISIFNADIKDCWGDGIYIGREMKAKNNFNINIHSAQIHNNRRNGISIISGEQITLNNIVVSNTNGTLPMSGIVLEPNSNEDILDDIKMNNPVTYNNRFGILIYLDALQGERAKKVRVNINSPIDQYSLNGVRVSEVSLKKNSRSIEGNINITNPSWRNNVNRFVKPKNENVRVTVYDK